MPTINIPAGNIIIAPQAFSREPVEHILEELCSSGHDFTGYIKVVSGDKLYLLFFFKSRPYAAAKSVGYTPESIPLCDFFSTLGTLDNSNALFSIHATDPVLLKSLLVFFQQSPTVKAPARLLNLDTIMDRIRKESADALIVLQKKQHIGLFFFKNNAPGTCYCPDTDFNFNHDATADEQMLSYALQPVGNVIAGIYRNTATSEDRDAATLSRSEMLQLLCGNRKADKGKENIVLRILSGPHQGEAVCGPVPCVLGRKDTDIVVSDPLASKRHAAIQLVNGSLLLMDLNSTNGTFVNGNRIKQHDILLGDVIMLGETTLSVEKIDLPS